MRTTRKIRSAAPARSPAAMPSRLVERSHPMIRPHDPRPGVSPLLVAAALGLGAALALPALAQLAMLSQGF